MHIIVHSLTLFSLDNVLVVVLSNSPVIYIKSFIWLEKWYYMYVMTP